MYVIVDSARSKRDECSTRVKILEMRGSTASSSFGLILSNNENFSNRGRVMHGIAFSWNSGYASQFSARLEKYDSVPAINCAQSVFGLDA